MSSATVCSTTTRGSWNTAWPLAIPATSLSPDSRSGPALRSRPRRAPSTSRAAGDHLRQHHRDRLQRLDLDVLVAARLGVLDGEHADRAFEPDDRHAGKAVESLLAGFGPVGEGRVLGGLGEVEDPAFGGDGPDEAFAHPQAW